MAFDTMVIPTINYGMPCLGGLGQPRSTQGSLVYLALDLLDVPCEFWLIIDCMKVDSYFRF